MKGTETFTILNGTTPVGTAVTVNVSAGAASAVYVLPAGTPAGTYIIQAVYNGTTNFLGYTDTSQTLWSALRPRPRPPRAPRSPSVAARRM